MTAPVPLLVFTDLDGTLLDHDSYSYAAAQSALDALRALGAPLVLASSKTAAEIAPLRAELGREACPAIVENGAGVLEAKALPDPNSDTYARLRSALATLPRELRTRFRGFADMDDAEVARVTGLRMSEAALARRRAFSEPGLWEGDTNNERAFTDALAEQGISARRGGRFLTLSFGGTKADRMAEIIARYRPGLTLALGDAPNDVEMLETADIGIVVANAHSRPLPKLRGEDDGRIRRTEKSGPAGWNIAVRAVVSALGEHTKTT